MRRLPTIFAFCAALFVARPLAAQRISPPKITVILIEGQVLSGKRPLQLGQRLEIGQTLKSGPDSLVHLVVNNASSLVLGPQSELLLGFQPKLLRGSLYSICDPRQASSVATPEAQAIGEANFLLEYDGESRVQVSRGSVKFGDITGKRGEVVQTLQASRLFNGRLEKASRLPKREAGELRTRWQRYELFHQQRHELLKHFK